MAYLNINSRTPQQILSQEGAYYNLMVAIIQRAALDIINNPLIYGESYSYKNKDYYGARKFWESEYCDQMLTYLGYTIDGEEMLRRLEGMGRHDYKGSIID